MKLKIHNVRIAFPQLFEPKTVNGEGAPAFSAAFLMAPDHPAVAELEKAFDVVGKDKWGAKWPQIKKELMVKDRLALHDGDVKADYAGYEGNMFLNSRNTVRPLVIDRDKTPLAATDGKPYAGCYVHASIELWCQDNNFGKRINATLRGVQFFKDGDAFAGGGTASEDEFEDIEEGAYADDLV